MVLSSEERVELLKKARAAKAAKKAELDAMKPTPVKGRPPKKINTLDLTPDLEVADTEINDVLLPNKPEIDDEPEIIERVEIKKIKKPKRRIVRKIIKEEYDSETTEEEYEEIVHQAPRRTTQKAKVKEIEKPRDLTPPREPEIRKSTFNLFSY